MEKVILKSVKDAGSKKTWNWIFGSLGGVNALLLLSKNYLGIPGAQDSLLIAFFFIVGLYLLRFVLFLFRNAYLHWFQLYKESIYGDAIVFLKDAFTRVHWLRKLDNIPDDQLKQTMALFCQQLKLIYDKKTKSVCAVSIKLARKNADQQKVTSDTQVRNLCRDKASQNRDTDAYNAQTHKIFSNTCFNNILSDLAQGKTPDKVYYLNNNIPANADYKNTSTGVYEGGILPYKSELVVPIIPHHNETENSFEMVGFLCVDCQTKNVFDTKYDVAILQGVADGIYDVILKHNQ